MLSPHQFSKAFSFQSSLNFGFVDLYGYELYRVIENSSEKGIFFLVGIEKQRNCEQRKLVTDSLVKVSKIFPQDRQTEREVSLELDHVTLPKMAEIRQVLICSNPIMLILLVQDYIFRLSVCSQRLQTDWSGQLVVTLQMCFVW